MDHANWRRENTSDLTSPKLQGHNERLQVLPPFWAIERLLRIVLPLTTE